MAIIELYKCAKVAGTTRVCDSYTPANGKKFRILDFCGETATGGGCAVMLMWDIDGAKTPLWVIKGSGNMPQIVGPQTEQTGDGTKKVGLCLRNDDAADVFMAGYAKIRVED